MSITPVLSLEERTQRAVEAWKFPVTQAITPFAIQKFYAHLYGLENFAGKRVLEIGGTDNINMFDFFKGIGADYEIVRLDPNPERRPYVRQMNFLKVDPEYHYDLIISLGVFEKLAIDRKYWQIFGIKNPFTTNKKRLRKLKELIASDGFIVIGTIINPCMFANEELQNAGLEIQYRNAPFYSCSSLRGEYSVPDHSELLILTRR